MSTTPNVVDLEAYYNELEGVQNLEEFASNPEPRCPCVLLIDASGSMHGNRINSVNSGIREFRNAILDDPVTASRAELAIVAFNHDNHIAQDFVTAQEFEPPTIQASGATDISGAIHQAITILEQRKRTYRANGIESYRPLVILITDGEPTADNPELLKNVSTYIASQEEGRHLTFFTFAVEGANMEKLAAISPPNRPPAMLHEARIEDLFLWLSNSLSTMTHSNPGDRLRLPTPDFLEI